MHQVITCHWSEIDLFWSSCFEYNVLVNWWAWVYLFSIRSEFSIFVELVHVRDVGTLLFNNHVPMRSECVKRVVCREFRHMILMPTPITVTYIGMYVIIQHVLDPSLNLYLHLCVDSSFIMNSLTLAKTKNGYYTSCCIDVSNDQIHLWVLVCAICMCVHKCTYVKCECVEHNRDAKVCYGDEWIRIPNCEFLS